MNAILEFLGLKRRAELATLVLTQSTDHWYVALKNHNGRTVHSTKLDGAMQPLTALEKAQSWADKKTAFTCNLFFVHERQLLKVPASVPPLFHLEIEERPDVEDWEARLFDDKNQHLKSLTIPASHSHNEVREIARKWAYDSMPVDAKDPRLSFSTYRYHPHPAREIAFATPKKSKRDRWGFSVRFPSHDDKPGEFLVSSNPGQYKSKADTEAAIDRLSGVDIRRESP